jgi:hypothetical protein
MVRPSRLLFALAVTATQARGEAFQAVVADGRA